MSRPVKQWEIVWEYEGEPELAALLADGWEPFAVVVVPEIRSVLSREEEAPTPRVYLRRKP